MREGKFIKQNVDRWETYKDDTKDPDELAERFVSLVEDLGYAKTFYPTSKITRYINALASSIFQSIYQNKQNEQNRISIFFRYELPLLFYKHRYKFYFVALFFLFFLLIAVLSSIKDITFITSILGEEYVAMTEENIEKGDPFGVYKDSNELMMFAQIAWNNVTVAFRTYAYGILAGVGTLYIIFENALMLGAFQTMFFLKGLGWNSILVIWIHGTIEIFSFIIEATAGLVLGVSWLFPGTYTRMYAFRQGAKESVKIIIGTVPFIILAAILESYVTRYTSMPIALSVLILLASFSLMLFYFFIYPYLLSKMDISIIDGKLVQKTVDSNEENA